MGSGSFGGAPPGSIEPHAFKGDIHLSVCERRWMSAVEEMLVGARYSPVSGGKWTRQPNGGTRGTACSTFQSHPVCAGGDVEHVHPPLQNVLNLLKTSLRETIRLTYRADGDRPGRC